MKTPVFLTALCLMFTAPTAFSAGKSAPTSTTISTAAPPTAVQQVTDYTQFQWWNAAPQFFSGTARFTLLPSIPDSPDRAALVEFQPNAATHWHSHSQGQYLIVTDGEGRTQEWGKPVQIIKKGDVVWCPPNVKHWHGATRHRAMSHIAITPNVAENKVVWMEKVDLESLSQ